MVDLSETRLIVGLGNPGREYEYTRHNLGFLVVEKLAKKLELKFSNSSFTKALMAQGNDQDKPVVLLLPQAYMNNAGSAVKQVVVRKNVDLKNILVVMDDIHFDFGQIKLRAKGSDGGHNGLTSIIEHLASEDFARLRLGIGSPARRDAMVDYVLGKFTTKEKKDLDNFVNEAVECCLLWLRDGINKAMGQFNKKKEKE